MKKGLLMLAVFILVGLVAHASGAVGQSASTQPHIIEDLVNAAKSVWNWLTS